MPRATARTDVFRAIADPTRRAILDRLRGGAQPVHALAEDFRQSRPAISKHVKILTECGLIVITPQGRERHCEARLQRLKEVVDWSEQYRQFWTARLDALEAYLAKSANSPKSEQAPRRGKPRKA